MFTISVHLEASLLEYVVVKLFKLNIVLFCYLLLSQYDCKQTSLILVTLNHIVTASLQQEDGQNLAEFSDGHVPMNKKERTFQ